MFVLLLLHLILTVIIPSYWIIFLGFGLISLYYRYIHKTLKRDQLQHELLVIVVITILGFCITHKTDKFNNLNKESFGNPVTISLCVPCIPPDIHKLESLVQNTNKQSKLPNEMIIGLSETTKRDSKSLSNKLNKISRFPVIVSNTEQKAYAGINRNRAADLASYEYVSFIDADDIMHPERLKIIAETIGSQGRPMGVVHGFTYDKVAGDLGTFDIWNSKKFWDYHNKYSRSESLNYPKISLHHGHPTYKSSVFESVKFTNRKRGQDAEMLRNVVDHYKGGVVYVEAPLTGYYKRSRIYGT